MLEVKGPYVCVKLELLDARNKSFIYIYISVCVCVAIVSLVENDEKNSATHTTIPK